MADANLAEAIETAERMYENGETEQALAKLEQLASQFPHNAEILTDLGIVQFSLGETEQALETIKQALIEDPDHQGALDNLREMYNILECEAGEVLEKLNFGEYMSRMEDAVEEDDFSAALEIAEEWTQEEPDNPRAWNDAAVIADEAGQHEAAKKYIKKAVELAPKNETFQSNYGKIVGASKLDRRAKARNYVQRAIELDPNDEAIQENKEFIVQNEAGQSKKFADIKKKGEDKNQPVPPSTCSEEYIRLCEEEVSEQDSQLNEYLKARNWNGAQSMLRKWDRSGQSETLVQNVKDNFNTGNLLELGEWLRNRSLIAAAFTVFCYAAQKADSSDRLDSFDSRLNKQYREESVCCDICGISGEFHTVNPLTGAYTGGVLSPVRCWRRCPECGLIFASPRPAGAILSDYYQKMNDDTQRIQRQLKRFTDIISFGTTRMGKIEELNPPGKKLLDVGGGIGLFASVSRESGFVPLVIDFGEQLCRFAEDKLSIETKCEDFMQAQFETKFDVVTGWEVVEHVTSPLQMMQKVSSCLKPGGLWCFSTPVWDNTFGRLVGLGSIWYREAEHLHYFSMKSVHKMINQSGMRLEFTRHSDESRGRQEFYARRGK